MHAYTIIIINNLFRQVHTQIFTFLSTISNCPIILLIAMILYLMLVLSIKVFYQDNMLLLLQTQIWKSNHTTGQTSVP